MKNEYIVTSDGNFYCVSTDELYHHGIKGQKWGVRRFQNSDGSLTSAGKKHMRKSDEKTSNQNSQPMSTKRKVAIASAVIGAAAVAAGAAYAAHKFSVNTKDLASKKYIEFGKKANDRFLDTGIKISTELYDKSLDAKESGNEDLYKTLKSKSAAAMRDYALQGKNAMSRASSDASSVSKSFKKSFDAVYGKNKRVIPEYTLRSMGIETVSVNKTNVNLGKTLMEQNKSMLNAMYDDLLK